MQVNLEIVLLWIIREFQPISVSDMAERIANGSIVIPTNDPRYLDYFNGMLIQGGSRALRSLMDAGLVKTIKDPQNPSSPKWVTLPALGLIQEMFNIRLTKLLREEPQGLTVFPFFGQPTAEVAHQPWAQVFVAMPFREDLKPVYTDHILKVASQLKLTCKRDDNSFSANSIMADIWSAIYNAEICIVDCTGRNPNVFYELGIAHTLGRKAILIAQTLEDIPFDVRHLRIIIYQYTPPGMQQFETTLAKTLQTELGLADTR